MNNYSTNSDLELIAALKADDQLALKYIISTYWERLMAVALNRLPNMEEAEECVQDIFYNLWRKRGTLELKYSLRTYLSVAVKYQILDLLDKKHRRLQVIAASDLDGDLEIAVSASADDAILEKELFARLEQTIQTLPEKCQVVYRMSREEGKNNKQIAAQLNVAEKTVEAHLTKAMKDIRNQMTAAAFPLFLLWLQNRP